MDANYYDYVTVTAESGEIFYPTLAQFEHVTLEGATVQYGNARNIYDFTGWEGSHE